MNPTETLLAYSREEATLEQVMRALVSHDDWLVDAKFAMHVTGREKFKSGFVLGSEPVNIPPGKLWFYTDEASAVTAADRARERGISLGLYVGGISGPELFAALPTNFESVHVNLGCAQEQTWFIPNDSFAVTALWAHAVALERWLGKPDSPEKFRAMRDYVGYIFFINPEHDAFVTAVGAGGKQNPAMVFTAIDCAQVVAQKYPHLKQQIVSGERLFSLLPRQGVDGIIFNPFGPGPQVVCDIGICTQVLQAMAPAGGTGAGDQ